MNETENIKLRTSAKAFAGVFVNVPVDARLVCENKITGSTKIKRPGLHFITPWNKKTLVWTGNTSFSCKFDNPLHNSEEWELTVKPVVVTYHVRKGKKASDDKTGIEKFYEQQEALKNVKEAMDSLIVAIVKNSKYDRLKGLQLDIGFIKNKGKNGYLNDLENEILYRIDSLSKEYGIAIDSIKFGDVDKPKVITEAKAEQEKQRIENETNLAKAINDRKIAELNAEADAIVSSVDYKLLYEFAKETKLNTEQITDILKRQLTKSNATIIEGGMSLEKLLAVALGKFNDYAQSQNRVNNNVQNIDEENVIYSTYSENSNDFIPRPRLR